MKLRKIAFIVLGFALISGCSSNETITIEVPARHDVVDIQELNNVVLEHKNEYAEMKYQDEEHGGGIQKGEIKTDVKPTDQGNTTGDEGAVLKNDVMRTVTLEIPKKVDHDVAFVSQAPYANWELPYKEACEEASLIMAAHYFDNEPLTKEGMDAEILKLVDWQRNEFGYYEDTTVQEMMLIAQKYFDFDVRRMENPTVNELKKELADGNLVIVPAAGQLLPNPNFRYPGPPYHVLLLRGYDSNEFITNDPGTRNGDGFKYMYNDLVDVIHDYNGGDILNGNSVVISVHK